MPHQRPKSASQDSYSYTFEHEIPALIQELAAVEAEKLTLQSLSPTNYLTRLVRREAAEKLSSQALQRAHEIHEEKVSRRLAEGAEDPETAKTRKPRRKKGEITEV